MANYDKKHHLNVDGDFFVDSTCEGCGHCINTAPECFSLNATQSYVSVQPTTQESASRVREAKATCPAHAIGDGNDRPLPVYVEPPPEPPPQPEQPIEMSSVTIASETLDNPTTP